MLQGLPGASRTLQRPAVAGADARKIFRLAFRDKGRVIDSVEHPLFLKWAALSGGGK